MTEMFHHRGVVGESIGVRLPVGTFQQLDAEGLRGLYQPICTSRHGLAAAVGLYLPQGFHDGNHRYGGSRRACCLVTATNDLDSREGAYPIVHTHHALGVIGNTCQSVAHRVETGFPAISDGARNIKLIVVAEFLPVGLLTGGQHEDDAQSGSILMETADGAHQYGLSLDGQKLLGDIRTHAQSLASSHDDDIVGHAAEDWVIWWPSGVCTSCLQPPGRLWPGR